MNMSIQQQVDRLKRKQEMISRCWKKDGGSKEVLDFFIEILPKMLDAERCSIFIHDSANAEVWLQCGTNMGEKQIVMPRCGSNVGEVIATGKPKMVSRKDQRSRTSELVDNMTGFQTRSMICVPIKSLDGCEVTGAIMVLNKKSRESFDENDLLLLEKSANHLEMVIQNIFVSQEMSDLSQQLSHKVDASDWAIKMWMGFLGTILLMAFGIIIYFAPTIFGVFQR
ncbi:MAG: GAF domain-containing protein [Magnetococcales bacterium]|nr:GAF domain-containing protein [Magnetococcales bacterium]